MTEEMPTDAYPGSAQCGLGIPCRVVRGVRSGNCGATSIHLRKGLAIDAQRRGRAVDDRPYVSDRRYVLSYGVAEGAAFRAKLEGRWGDTVCVPPPVAVRRIHHVRLLP